VITVAVDPTNPGQFFACCGLLELADRLWPGAEGWFAEGGREFRLACDGSTAEKFIDALMASKIVTTMTSIQTERLSKLSAMTAKERAKTQGLDDERKALSKLRREMPLILSGEFKLRLDWFTDNRAGGSRFKTWAGQQSVLDIAVAMKDAISAPVFRSRPSEEWYTYSVAKCGLPFNLDSDIGGQGGALDIGFSFDPLAGNAATRIETTARPFLELMAFVGLQRFRPRPIERENRFLYCAWNRPLPITVAAPAACGMMSMRGAPLFEFRLLYRTDYLKSFLPAIPFTGGSDE